MGAPNSSRIVGPTSSRRGPSVWMGWYHHAWPGPPGRGRLKSPQLAERMAAVPVSHPDVRPYSPGRPLRAPTSATRIDAVKATREPRARANPKDGPAEAAAPAPRDDDDGPAPLPASWALIVLGPWRRPSWRRDVAFWMRQE